MPSTTSRFKNRCVTHNCERTLLRTHTCKRTHTCERTPLTCTSMYFPKREELSFLNVFAFPNASRMGFDCNSLENTASTPRHSYRYRQLACQHKAQANSSQSSLYHGSDLRGVFATRFRIMFSQHDCTGQGVHERRNSTASPCLESATPPFSGAQKKEEQTPPIATCLSRIDRERPELVAVDARNCSTCFAASVFPAPDSPEIRMH